MLGIKWEMKEVILNGMDIKKDFWELINEENNSCTSLFRINLLQESRKKKNV